MVFIVKKWEDIKEHIPYAKCPLYRIIKHKDGKIEIRVKAGMMAWKGVFESEDDSKFQEVLNTLKTYGAIEVVDAMPDEQFI